MIIVHTTVISEHLNVCAALNDCAASPHILIYEWHILCTHAASQEMSIVWVKVVIFTSL